MFFEQFYRPLVELPVSCVKPLVDAVKNAPESWIMKRSDPTLAEGTFIPVVYHGNSVNRTLTETMASLLTTIQEASPSCLRERMLYKAEISIIPSGGKLRWHHDIYMKDKLTERVHVPLVTTPDVRFLAKWFTDPRVWSFRMFENHAYRFNNRVPHTVINSSSITRYHLLLNYMRVDAWDHLRSHADQLAAFEKNECAVTAADEVFYYVNSEPELAELYSMTGYKPQLTEHQLDRLFTDVTPWNPKD